VITGVAICSIFRAKESHPLIDCCTTT